VTAQSLTETEMVLSTGVRTTPFFVSTALVSQLRFQLAILSLLLIAGRVCAETPTRAQALAIAKAFASHRWTASEKNVMHGLDADRIEVQTPNRSASSGLEGANLWKLGEVNIGVPYKWGGFDSLETYDRGIAKGRAAGDLYSLQKRRRGGAAVSRHAVGVDCSGFISRCWMLPLKQSTSSLPSICVALRSTHDLRPGDVMNQPGGHVLLFVQWLDDSRQRAFFYEAEPFSKVIRSEQSIEELQARGFRPLRSRKIRE